MYQGDTKMQRAYLREEIFYNLLMLTLGIPIIHFVREKLPEVPSKHLYYAERLWLMSHAVTYIIWKLYMLLLAVATFFKPQLLLSARFNKIASNIQFAMITIMWVFVCSVLFVSGIARLLEKLEFKTTNGPAVDSEKALDALVGFAQIYVCVLAVVFGLIFLCIVGREFCMRYERRQVATALLRDLEAAPRHTWQENQSSAHPCDMQDCPVCFASFENEDRVV